MNYGRAMKEELLRLLGPEKVFWREGELERYSVDALGRYRAFRAASQMGALPLAVVRPASTGEVVQVVRLASEKGVAIIPYGGGTGVMGGAATIREGVVLDIKGMSRVLEVDKASKLVVVEAGVVLEELEQELGRHGMILGHDPWSRPIATVGGAISTNGVGYLAAKYGPMGDQVLGLEVVLADGKVIATKGVPKASSGPYLNSLFIGSEGTLGIVTKAVLKAFAMPEKRAIGAFSFNSFDEGFCTVQELFNRGLQPSVVDFAEEFPWEDGSPSAQMKVRLYLGFDGSTEHVRVQTEEAFQVCKKWGASKLESEVAQAFWERRHDIALRYKSEVIEGKGRSGRRRETWRMDYLHVAIPAGKVLEYRKQCGEILGRHGVPVREWSLWGRPEFFSFLIADPSPVSEGVSEVMAGVVDELLSLAQDVGGSMEYCHGVGLKLGHLMEREMGAGMDVVRTIKRELDPKGILNPGKLGL